ncbi:hypothetical protein [Streptomyces sp. FH025]|uniref:hypothetical protein n=1 Tax=Streptomyces sp. FH025 TaxID=2815937 RepID=UPI001A9F9EA0|nr:hypothetical protein [Streptomyces sp. FH025]MBO1414873.1 hypothetical protein [Streptomyces sp. FH025]
MAISAAAVMGGTAGANAAAVPAVNYGQCDHEGPAGCTTYFQPARAACGHVVASWNSGYRGDGYFAYKYRTYVL